MRMRRQATISCNYDELNCQEQRFCTDKERTVTVVAEMLDQIDAHGGEVIMHVRAIENVQKVLGLE